MTRRLGCASTTGSHAKYGIGARNVCLSLINACSSWCLPLFVMLVRGAMLGDWAQALLFALGTAVGLVPEMLPVVTSVCLSEVLDASKQAGHR